MKKTAILLLASVAFLGTLEAKCDRHRVTEKIELVQDSKKASLEELIQSVNAQMKYEITNLQATVLPEVIVDSFTSKKEVSCILQDVKIIAVSEEVTVRDTGDISANSDYQLNTDYTLTVRSKSFVFNSRWLERIKQCSWGGYSLT